MSDPKMNNEKRPATKEDKKAISRAIGRAIDNGLHEKIKCAAKSGAEKLAAHIDVTQTLTEEMWNVIKKHICLQLQPEDIESLREGDHLVVDACGGIQVLDANRELSDEEKRCDVHFRTQDYEVCFGAIRSVDSISEIPFSKNMFSDMAQAILADDVFNAIKDNPEFEGMYPQYIEDFKRDGVIPPTREEIIKKWREKRAQEKQRNTTKH